MEAYIGEIHLFAGSFAPQGWALCLGQLLPISGNQALFSLLGTTFGGDGQTTFALPDLRGRIPLGIANNYRQGEPLGQETVTLGAEHLPVHAHPVAVSQDRASSGAPAGAVLARGAVTAFGAPTPSGATLDAAAVAPAGAGQAHDNVMPYAVVNFIICTNGIFPPRS